MQRNVVLSLLNFICKIVLPMIDAGLCANKLYLEIAHSVIFKDYFISITILKAVSWHDKSFSV